MTWSRINKVIDKYDELEGYKAHKGGRRVIVYYNAEAVKYEWMCDMATVMPDEMQVKWVKI